MAITDYASLQTAIGNYLHRGDLAGVIPDFISLAESKLNRLLRIRAMENVQTGNAINPVSLPAGFVEMISLTVTSGGNQYPLTYINPSEVKSLTGLPLYYTLIGDNLVFEPSGSGSYTLNYYKRFDPLSSGTNWLITNAPDLYLYASLLEAAPYIKDQTMVNTWREGATAVIEMLNSADRKDRYGTNLVVRAA